MLFGARFRFMHGYTFLQLWRHFILSPTLQKSLPGVILESFRIADIILDRFNADMTLGFHDPEKTHTIFSSGRCLKGLIFKSVT
jgi:hypothetical protein